MMAELSLARAAVAVAFGALAGGLTNAVAIWMLFHPYAPRRVGWLKFQGALPKNKSRLAKTIGRTVGQRLLTSDDLVHQLRTPEMRQAFDATVRELIRGLLETERGALAEALTPAARAALDRVRDHMAHAIAGHLARYARGEPFRAVLATWLERARTSLAQQRVSEVLTQVRRAQLRRRVEQWVRDAARSPEVETTLTAWVERQIDRLAADATPLLERLPADLVAALERAIAGYLPVAIDHLGRALRDPATRSRLERALHDLLERFARDLLLHQRIVARLVVTERTVAKLFDAFEREGADEVARLLDEPAVRDQIARRINDAVVQFLQRPLADHAARLGPERLAGLKRTAARHMVAALQDPTTRSFLIERLDAALHAAERRTWGDLLAYLPPEQVAQWAAELAQAPRLEAWTSHVLRRALDVLITQPIGRPADWLGPDAAERAADVVAPALWDWIEDSLPRIVERVDVAAIVEQKVLGFSLQRMEEIVRTATQRELDVIVRLGYVLGGVVGAVAYAASLLV